MFRALIMSISMILGGIASGSAIEGAAFPGTTGMPQAVETVDGARCNAVAARILPHGKIADAVLVAAGDGAPAYCRVRGSSHPTADSDIGFELYLPVESAWNGRYLQVGNGGLAGSIPERLLAAGLAQGFAVAGTDDGHEAAEFDGRWAVGHPEKRTDFAYRALKETTDAAKLILAAYYGRSAAHSYFQGCSAGGREALMEAQRFPDDFDGIVAGAPAAYWTHLAAYGPWVYQAVSRGGWLSEAELENVQRAVRAACGADKDGVLRDSMNCKFDPASLKCRPGQIGQCLTDAQVAALHRIYGGIKDARTGATIIAGYSPGGEAESHAWATWEMGSSPDGKHSLSYILTHELVGNVLLGGAPIDVETFDSSRDVARLDAAFGSQVNAVDPDLGAFQRHGGKLIQFHGWYDQAIPTRSSIDYYRSVKARMGDTSAFYRLFLAPGMLHCGGGPGPNVLATLPAIVDWVEHGKAPQSLVATKYVSDDPKKGVKLTRPVCRFPNVAAWDGKGDRSRAGSYVCTPSKAS
jgi:feruloyl esterase